MTTIFRPGRLLSSPALRLLQTRGIRRYWTATAISALGDGVSLTAIPATAAIYLHADTSAVSSLVGLAWLPSALFSLHAGAFADRSGRQRELMIAADIARFALLASVPTAAVIGMLTLTQLYVVVFFAASATVLSSVCAISVFASLVPRSQTVEGQTLDAAARTVASLVGPGAGGILVQILRAPFAIVVDAVSFLSSALLLAITKPAATVPAREQRTLGLGAGLRYIAGTQTIRSLLLLTASTNFFGAMLAATLLLYMNRQLGMPAGYLGIVLSASALGSFLGLSIAPAISRTLRHGHILAVGATLGEWPILIVPLVSGSQPTVLAFLLASAILSGVGASIMNVAVGSVFMATVPETMRSRVRGSYQFISFGTRPLGAVVAGFVGQATGLRPTMWLIAVGGTLCVSWVVLTPLGRVQLNLANVERP